MGPNQFKEGENEAQFRVFLSSWIPYVLNEPSGRSFAINKQLFGLIEGFLSILANPVIPTDQVEYEDEEDAPETVNVPVLTNESLGATLLGMIAEQRWDVTIVYNIREESLPLLEQIGHIPGTPFTIRISEADQ